MGNLVSKCRMRNRKTPEHVRCTVIISLGTEEVEIYHNSSAVLGNVTERPRVSEPSSLVDCSSTVILGDIDESKNENEESKNEPRAPEPSSLVDCSSTEEVIPFIFIHGYDHPLSTESDRRYSFVPPPEHICACD